VPLLPVVGAVNISWLVARSSGVVAWALIVASAAWGLLLAAVQITSLLRTHMSQSAWRRVHLLSYALFATTTVHALTAGTDTNALLPTGLAVIFGAAAVFTGATLWWARTEATRQASPASRSPVGA